MKLIKSFFVVIALALSLTLTAPQVLAATIIKPDKESGSVSISQEEPIKNLYTAGATITINTDIEKNLYVAGGMVIINNSVGETINVAGGTIITRGDVGGSAHLGGGNIVVESKIADDLFVGGGNVTISFSSAIGGDLIIAGGNVVINAPVAGNILIGAGQATINSKVGGSIKGAVEGLTLRKNAEIAGDLTYKSAKEAVIIEGAVISGETTFEEMSKSTRSGGRVPDFDKGAIFGLLAALYFTKLFVFMITGLVLVYLLKKLTKPVVTTSLTKFWPSLGIGFAGMIVTPVLMIILATTVIGLGLAGILAAAYGLFLLLAALIAHILCGSWLIKTIKKREEYRLRWQEVLVGGLVLGCIGWIPIIGWLIICVFVMIVLGSLFQLTHKALFDK